MHTYPSRDQALADLDVRDLKVGADVHCERDDPPRGTWDRYAGRVGRVMSINVQTFRDGRVYVEIGVTITLSKSEPSAWFGPCELRRGYGAYKAPRSRATASRAL